MHFIAAPDKFKGSMTAPEAAEAITKGIKSVRPDLEVLQFPLSDGGEGLVQALTGGGKGRIINTSVTDPLGRLVEAQFGIMAAGNTAVIEMASASGLALLTEKEKNPALATTHGTGELVRAALDRGCRKIIIGIGGSATNDGGAGMARALGIELLDSTGRMLENGGLALQRLHRIDRSGLDPRLQEVEILVACDVDNPLTGPAGASHVYGPQKGATPVLAAQLDSALAHYAAVIKKDLNLEVENIPGAGAAGGLGAGLLAFLRATLHPGIELVLSALDIEKHLDGCRLLFTGEGKLDAQTTRGKAPVGIARKAGLYNVPVVALAGSIEGDMSIFHREGISACFALADGPLSVEESIERGPLLLAAKTAELVRFWNISRARCPSPE